VVLGSLVDAARRFVPRVAGVAFPQVAATPPSQEIGHVTNGSGSGAASWVRRGDRLIFSM
jgi:hypothetical protein